MAKIKKVWYYWKWDRKRKCSGGAFKRPRRRYKIKCTEYTDGRIEKRRQ